MSDWKGITKDIEEWDSFVYLIVNKVNGKRYIGQKNLKRKLTRQPLKGYKRKRVSYPESDWKDYYGSSEALQKDIETQGTQDFERYILILCKSKWAKNYYEAKLQFDNEVLLSDDWYNGIINVRMNRRPMKSMIKKTRYLKLLKFYEETK
jgi:hypothetical protein